MHIHIGLLRDFFDAMECELDINSVGSDPRSEQEKDAITSSVRINPD